MSSCRDATARRLYGARPYRLCCYSALDGLLRIYNGVA